MSNETNNPLQCQTIESLVNKYGTLCFFFLIWPGKLLNGKKRVTDEIEYTVWSWM